MNPLTRSFRSFIRFTGILIFLCIGKSPALADTWSGNRVPPTLVGNVYTIATCANLAWVAQQVNAGNPFSGYTFKVTNDLNLNNLPWTPIGNAANRPFQGFFDGQNHIISNLYISSNSYAYCGLFGYVNGGNSNDAVAIQNITLNTVNVKGTKSSGQEVGALVGYTLGYSASKYIIISNCKVIGGSVTTNSGTAADAIGGLVGICQDNTSITGCTVTNLTVTSNKAADAAGFIGDVGYGSPTSYINISNCQVTGNTQVVSKADTSTTTAVGGFIGGLYFYANPTITNCTSNANVTAYTSYVGGFVGFIGFYSTNAGSGAQISNCSSSGNVMSFLQGGGFAGLMAGGTLNSCYANGNVQSTQQQAGGFVGYLSSDPIAKKTGSPVITNCFATGNTITPNYCGGFVGYQTLGSITYSYAMGITSSSTNYAGGFVGNMNGGTISNCFATGNTTTPNYCGGFVGYQKLGSITYSYAMGITASTNYAGGFVGNMKGGTISNCYAVGPSSGQNYIGGFVGYGTSGKISNSYAAGNVYGIGNSNFTGGFFGYYDNDTIQSCVFDMQGTGQTSSFGDYNNNEPDPAPSGLTTAQMTGTDTIPELKGTWTFQSGYYPQLSNLFNSSNANVKGWSALSAVPLYPAVLTDNTNYIHLNFTAPVSSAPSTSSSITWAPNYQPSDQGRMNFMTGGVFWLTHTGTASFIAKDASARVKNFFISIGSLPFARYFVNGASGVDNNSTNGINWTSPYKTIQYALDQRLDTTQSIQIWVAKGTYTPARDTSGTSATGATSTFSLKNKIAIYGGFFGNQSTEFSTSEATMLTFLNKRNLKNNASIITSNATPSNFLINYRPSDIQWNGALIDGFTITGAASGATNYAVNVPPNATIQNCKIVVNGAGGLMLGSASTATNVLVADNNGIGINFAGTNSTVINASIVNNTGAGIYYPNASNTAINCILWNNGSNFGGTATPKITYSAGSSNYGSNAWSTGTGNIDLLHRSPNFKDGRNANPAKRNYELLLISPYLGNGSATANSLAIDANGKPRKYNSTIDMGAFEKWDGITVNGSTVSNIRAGINYTSSTSGAYNMNPNDTLEVYVTPGTSFNMQASTINTHWLELGQDTIAPCQLTNGTIIADSTLYVRRFSKSLSGKGVWSFFGAPFNTATMRSLDGAIDENSVRIEGYNESARALNGIGYAWAQGRLTPDSVMLAGKGYALSFNKKVPQNNIGQTVIFSSPSKTTFNETGSPTTQAFRLSATTAPVWYNTGWNFIANPLPQPAVISSMWNSSSTSYYGAVYVYKPVTDSYNVIPASNVIAATANTNIAPGQGFFVQTDWDGATITFQSTTASNPVLQAMAYVRPVAGANATSAPVTPATFRFNVAGGDDDCNTYVIFDPRAHAAVEPMEDNPVIAGMGSTPALQLSTTGQGSSLSLAINRLPFAGAVMTVPLQLYVPAAGTYTITMPQSDTIANVVLLQDSVGNVHNLSTGAGYTFNATQGGITQNFTLIFNSASTGVQELKGLTILQNHRRITITSDSLINRIALYTIGGQLLFDKRPNAYQFIFDLPAQTELFLLNLTTPQGVMTKKLISR